MNFRWDEKEDISNTVKYGVSFAEAMEILKDPFHLSILSKRFGYLDERWVSMGSSRKKIIVVCHQYIVENRGEEHIEIHSARKATKKERQSYERIK
jgi:uncharacterized protein